MTINAAFERLHLRVSSSTKKWGMWFTSALVGAALCTPALAAEVELRVLVIATGTPAQDQGLDLIDDVLTNIGVRFEVLNARTTALTAARLSAGTRGNYNGIILTDSQLSYFDPAVGYQSAFSLAEWQILHQFEQTFGVRESVMGGWPAIDASLDLNYGLQYVGYVDSATPVQARWLAPAGGREYFEYVNASNPLTVDDWSYVTRPSGGAGAPTVQPLLTVNGDPNQILVSRLTYANGREVLFSSITPATYLIHAQILAYEFLNFATKGVFIGARHISLATHVDDLFLSTDLWDPVSNTTPDAGNVVRMDGNDVSKAISAQNALRSRNPVAASFLLDMVFNGDGAASGDPLTTAVQANANSMRFINHTFTHADMTNAPYDEALSEITQNQTVWTTYGFPGYTAGRIALVTGRHSGLHTDTLAFPDGMNRALFDAARAAGITYMASDSSQPGENIERYAPGYTIVMLPRRPSAVFYNVATPPDWVDEYNYIFRERFIEAGQDPCTIPGAICSPRNYSQILAAESELAMRQLLEFRYWPYFMHQANLKDYDGTGKTLLFDWINAVVARYSRNMKLPFKSLAYSTIGGYSRDRLVAATATINATWNLATNQVTLRSGNKTARIWVTGVSGGALYGGQFQRQLTLSTSQTYVYAINRALTQ